MNTNNGVWIDCGKVEPENGGEKGKNWDNYNSISNKNTQSMIRMRIRTKLSGKIKMESGRVKGIFPIAILN